MERVVQFLKEAETYYLATVEGDQPRVRPFGTAHIFEGKLYIQTGKVKDVSKQIHANPKVEICAYKNGEWLRVAGELVEDDRREARQSMLDAYPSLQNMYSAVGISFRPEKFIIVMVSLFPSHVLIVLRRICICRNNHV